MNYSTWDEQSDVDSKLLVIPSFEDIALGRKEIASVHIMSDNDEHVEIRDVRAYFKLMLKQNINFLEVLFSDFVIVNNKYSDLYYELVSRREDIAHANTYLFMKACKGMVHQKAAALKHPYPSKELLLENHGYDAKQLQNALRLCEFAERYSKGESFEECLCSNELEYMMDVKRYRAGIDADKAEKMMNVAVKKIDGIEAAYNTYRKNETDPEVLEFLENNLLKLFSRAYDVKLEH
jgi:hypothetical protein